MAEVIRSIEVTLTVDTNKRTIVRSIEAHSLDEAVDLLQAETEGLLG